MVLIHNAYEEVESTITTGSNLMCIIFSDSNTLRLSTNTMMLKEAQFTPFGTSKWLQ